MHILSMYVRIILYYFVISHTMLDCHISWAAFGVNYCCNPSHGRFVHWVWGLEVLNRRNSDKNHRDVGEYMYLEGNSENPECWILTSEFWILSLPVYSFLNTFITQYKREKNANDCINMTQRTTKTITCFTTLRHQAISSWEKHFVG